MRPVRPTETRARRGTSISRPLRTLALGDSMAGAQAETGDVALRQSVRFQLRLISCHVGGVVAEFIAMPRLLAAGLELRNVVLAWVLGVVLFLILAIVGGLVWRRSIMARPILWAAAAPLALGLTIYLLLRSLSGFEAGDARMAMEASFVGGLCALFSSGILVAWTCLAPAGPFSEQGRSK